MKYEKIWAGQSTSKVHRLFLHKKKTKDTQGEGKMSPLYSVLFYALSFELVHRGYFSDFTLSLNLINHFISLFQTRGYREFIFVLCFTGKEKWVLFHWFISLEAGETVFIARVTAAWVSKELLQTNNLKCLVISSHYKLGRTVLNLLFISFSQIITGCSECIYFSSDFCLFVWLANSQS